MNAVVEYTAIIAAFSFIAIGFYEFVMADNEGWTAHRKKMFFGSLIFSALIFVTLFVANKNMNETKQHEYAVFLDGNSVDAGRIDFSLYHCRYDDENKQIYLTAK